jgi:hypothetical protein
MLEGGASSTLFPCMGALADEDTDNPSDPEYSNHNFG